MRPGPKPRDTVAYLWDTYIPEPNSGCWLWEGPVNEFGYGVFEHNGKKTHRAHRLSLMLKTDHIGTGLLACHSCDNPFCINPDHLFWGTHKDNMMDASRKGRVHNRFQSSKTHCRKGHEFSPENTYLTSKGRSCRECGRIRARDYYYRNLGRK